MPAIKFSHKYPKLRNIYGKITKEATLLEVVKINLEDLDVSFLNYDTDIGAKGHFPLPHIGQFLMLLFLKQCGIFGASNLFTTLRRWTPEKERYYKGQRGEKFMVEVKEESC